MKKSTFFAAVLLVAMFSSVFTVVSGNNAIIASGYAETPTPEDSSTITPDWTPKPLGSKGMYIENITGTTITIDGVFSDWATVEQAKFGSIYLSVAFDDDYVYVYAKWADTSHDTLAGKVNKTNNNAWTVIPGSNDILSVGFSDGVDSDIWVWTASTNKTDGTHAYEMDLAGVADSGDLPHIFNWNTTHPLYDELYDPLTSPELLALPNGTLYWQWLPQTPDGSQVDVNLASSWAGGNYEIEMMRLLDTTQGDDLVLDMSDVSDYSFYYGVANKDTSQDMLITMSSKVLDDTNEAPSLTFNAIVNPVDESLTITGTVYDDYTGWTLRVHMTGWDYGYPLVPSPRLVSPTVNLITGNWSYLLVYKSTINTEAMPLGDWEIFAYFTPLYDDPITLNQTLSIVDTHDPQILGVVNVRDTYTSFMPNDTDIYTITAGVLDDHTFQDYLRVEMYSWKDDEVARKTDFVQFSSGGNTWNGNLTLEYTFNEMNNYTYYINAWDEVNNKVTSARYWFIYGQPPIVTPGFGILAGLFGLAAAAFIIYKKVKK